jgi:hypothetical protein
MNSLCIHMPTELVSNVYPAGLHVTYTWAQFLNLSFAQLALLVQRRGCIAAYAVRSMKGPMQEAVCKAAACAELARPERFTAGSRAVFERDPIAMHAEGHHHEATTSGWRTHMVLTLTYSTGFTFRHCAVPMLW